MRRGLRVSALVLVVLSGTLSLSAQVTTGALTGNVTHEGQPLPGVTVTIASPAMQGTRVAYSYVNGDYNFTAIPPGDYTVTFEMEGMTPETKTVTIGLARTERVNAEMALEAVAEMVTVTAAAPTVLETTELQANYTAALVESLPMARTLQAAAQLAPGVTLAPGSTPQSNYPQMIIAGASSWDSLYLVNGAVTNENLFGQSDNLFIEDAIQETSVLVGAISAEYGRFTGGVVSSITKSGGNEFSGSFRDSFTNLAWSDTSALGEEKPDSELNETYEATLGGRILRDRLWFFLAGRYAETNRRGFFTNSLDPRPTSVETDERYEYKLTAQPHPKHSIVASWLDFDVEQTNLCGYGCWDEDPIDPIRWLPRYMATARYNGIVSSNFLVEAGYSARDVRWHDSGSEHRTTDWNDPRDIALGTWAYDIAYGGMWGAPVFCGPCDDEIRENETWSVKGTWYLATGTMGTHNVVAGYETFTESRLANNYQSGSDFGLYIYSTPPQREADGTLRPIVSYGDLIIYYPIPILSQGSDFVTDSLFLNDKWDLGAKWSFNIGLRYDRNDGRDSADNPVSNDSAFSPRLGVIHDIRGDGRFRVNASYSTYVSKIWEGFGGDNGGGNPWYIGYVYLGPTVGGLGTGLGSFDVLEQVFEWFLAQGGVEASDLVVFAAAPGVNIRVTDLASPRVDEWTVGFGVQLGAKGFARVDYIDRSWKDFYATSTTPGDVVDNPLIPGDVLDVVTNFNSNELVRTYKAVTMQASYRLTDHASLGGNYTWSQSKGDQTDFGISFWSPFSYPEYKAFPQNAPVGYLPADQTHKARLWASYDQPLGGFGALNVSLLESYDSGHPYSAWLNIATFPYVANPGYATPPWNVPYFFSDRGEFRWEAMTSTDLALNWELPIHKASVFIQGEVLNVFNEQAQINGDTSVRLIAPFNPFTETPKECPQGQSDCTGFNWQKRSSFGTATMPTDYQLPRTYRFSAGVRF